MSKTQHPITDELLDQLLANYQNPEDLIGADGILKQLTKKLVERALDAELTHHLGHDKHQPVVSERALHLADGYPVVRQQLGQSAGLLRRQSR